MRLEERLRREAWRVSNEVCDNRSRRHGRTPTPACRPGQAQCGPCMLVDGIVALVRRERAAAARRRQLVVVVPPAAPAPICDLVHGAYGGLHRWRPGCPPLHPAARPATSRARG